MTTTPKLDVDGSPLSPVRPLRAAMDAYSVVVAERTEAGRTFTNGDHERAVKAALEAAAPLIVAAELERLAWWIESQPVELADMTPAGKQYRSGKEFVSGALRRRAAGLRGVSGVSADGGEKQS